jgi:ribosomal protein S18 acetylase RimI-like enzyme
MPSPAGPGDVRLRKLIVGDETEPAWPAGFVMRTMRPGDERPVHSLLTTVFDDGGDGPFDEWWDKRSHDPEFDPELCFLVFDPAPALVAVALCWTSGFLRDLAVHATARRAGIGEALMRQVFAACQARGASHVDLKTNVRDNADAVRLYRRLGMVEVGWEGQLPGTA